MTIRTGVVSRLPGGGVALPVAVFSGTVSVSEFCPAPLALFGATSAHFPDVALSVAVVVCGDHDPAPTRAKIMSTRDTFNADPLPRILSPVVVSGMVSARYESRVFNAVVSPIIVSVVYVFERIKIAANVRRHDKPMFQFIDGMAVSVSNVDFHISIRP